ncbi:MAG TPA: RHS repeat-associated core domain-containing protein [Nitratidesulfovibrio sp.]|nr:RHS repeat-associated core domain-containing protein [Nitratidesulfovibrio sp.]
MSAATRGRASRRAPAQRSPQAMSTEDFLRTVVFAKRARDDRPASAGGAVPGGGTVPTGGFAPAGPGYGANAFPAAAPAATASATPAPSAPDSRAGVTPGGAPAASATAPQSGDIPPALNVQCAFSPDGRLRAKQERCGGRAASYDYSHDERGHLTVVRRDGQVAERYTYNAAGQRTEARVAPLPGMSRDALRTMETERAFGYDNAGRLVRAGRARYMYAPDGTLRCREEGRNSTWFYYGGGGNAAGGAPHASPDPHSPHAPHRPYDQLAPVALDSVVLPGGDIIRYRFGDNGMPFMVLRNHAPSEEYQWLDPLRLARFRDHRTGSDYTFHYGGGRVPEAVTVRGPALDSLDGNLLDPSIFRKAGEPAAPQRSATFRIGCDQVGTPKVLLDPDGRVVKRMEYDSFGNPLLDTCPYFFLPLGFAGGLADRHTGLVRFGFRDYDPRTGRFTAPDPLGDTGGDHDPYDYCVDDPVSAFDPLGLEGEGILKRLRPWWSYPYGSKEKKEGIAKMQEQAGPRARGFATGFLTIDKAHPITYAFDKIAEQKEKGDRAQSQNKEWDPTKHPRDSETGKFVDK